MQWPGSLKVDESCKIADVLFWLNVWIQSPSDFPRPAELVACPAESYRLGSKLADQCQLNAGYEACGRLARSQIKWLSAMQRHDIYICQTGLGHEKYEPTYYVLCFCTERAYIETQMTDDTQHPR